MLRALFTVLFVAVSITPSCLASHGRVGSGATQLSAASRASLCDRLDAELGPKHVSFAKWTPC
jgi:tetrahydromethanopterin S-methyltransferase subunit D